MNKRLQLVWRTGISLALGLFLGKVCLGLGINETRRVLQCPQDYSRSSISIVEKKLKEYHQQHQAYPKRLSQLPNWAETPVLDGWGQPLTYLPQGQNYLLISYGADRKSGGTGLNCDLTNLKPKPPQSRTNDQEVLSNPIAGNLIKGAVVCGLLTTVLMFGSVSPVDLTRRGTGTPLIKVTLTLVAAGAISFFIMLADVPSGH